MQLNYIKIITLINNSLNLRVTHKERCNLTLECIVLDLTPIYEDVRIMPLLFCSRIVTFF